MSAYKVVTGTYPNLFESECNKALADDWVLQGGVAMQYNLGSFILAQAFVKCIPKPAQRFTVDDERNFAARGEACTNEDEPGGW